jgi:hypothetical protein
MEGRPAFESAPAAVEETRQIYRSLLKHIGEGREAREKRN